jgi:hypothetical protein
MKPYAFIAEVYRGMGAWHPLRKRDSWDMVQRNPTVKTIGVGRDPMLAPQNQKCSDFGGRFGGMVHRGRFEIGKGSVRRRGSS